MNDTAEPWFARWPDLRDWELERFRALELPVRVEEPLDPDDQMVVWCEVRFRGEPLEVQVVYPSEYPELPPAVLGPPGLLDRHQHLFGGSFCLLERPLDDWPARDWGAADLVAERLRALLEDTEAGPERVREAEAPMPEPVSAYFQHAPDAAVLVPSDVRPQGDEGVLGVRRVTPHLYVVEGSGKTTAPDTVLELLPSSGSVKVNWKRLSAAPLAGYGDGPSIAAWVRQNHPGLLSAPAPPVPPKLRASRRVSGPPPLEMCLLVFEEEGPSVGERRDAYLFVLVDRTHGGVAEHLVHAQLVEAEERQRRIVELAGLVGKRAVVLGLGTIGAECALHLARAGCGDLELVDCDRFEFGNTARHPLGLEYVGLNKTAAVTTACRRANPFCRTRGHDIRLGDTGWLAGQSPLARLRALIEGADVVIDATGSHQIAQVASRVAAEHGTAFLAGWMTDGYYGGEAVRCIPGVTACWNCYSTAARDGTLVQPEAGPSVPVTAQGCSHPTTAGAGFDAAEVAAALSRLAAQTALAGDGYPDAPFDRLVLNLRRAADDSEHPRTITHRLLPNEDCPGCQAAAGALAAR